MKILLCRTALAGCLTIATACFAATEVTPATSGASAGPAAAVTSPTVPVNAAASRGQPAVANAAPAELVIANQPIATLRATIGSVTPSARVAGVKSRMRELEEADLEWPAVAKAVSLAGEQAYAIEINGKHLVGIFAGDLDLEAREQLDDVARRTVANFNNAREAYLELHMGKVIARKGGLIALATFVFVLALYLLGRLHRHLREALTAAAEREAARLAGAGPGDKALAASSAGRGLIARLAAVGVDVSTMFANGTRRGLMLVFYAIVTVAAYLWLTYGLGQFAYTRPWRDRLVGWLVDLLLGFVHAVAVAMPGLFAIAVICLLARLVVRGMSALLARVETGKVRIRGLYPETVPATRSIATVLIWLFALTVSYPLFPGSDSDIFKGVSLFAGLMVTLGSSGIVGQWMSGMILVYSRSLRPGDLVKAGDNEGVVSSLGLMFTKIRTPIGEEITIPNSALISGSIRNFTRLSKGTGSRVTTSVTIGYDAPWRQVHAMLLEAAARTDGLRTEPAPFVLQRALNDFYVEYELVGRIDAPLELPFVMTCLHGNVQDVFNEYGVQILSPHFLNQPAQPVVVDKRKWFAAPASPDDPQPGKGDRQ